MSDDVIREFAAVGTYDNLESAIRKRFGGLTDSLLMGFPPNAPPELQKEVVRGLQTIECEFEGFPTQW